MSYRAWFQCINPQCGATYPLNSVVYQCKECHSLLEVQHDTAALSHRSAAAWMRLFEDRYKSTQWPFGSGVWGKKEWILPEIKDENVVSLYEGGTNLFWAERFGKVDRDRGPLDQALRQHAQRLVQRPWHDRACLAGEADDLGRCAHQGGGLRLDGRHLGRAGHLLRGGGHPIHRAAAPGQNLHRPVDPARLQRRPGALPGYRLRRLHEAGAGDYQRPDALPGQLHELPARRRPEDRGHRDRPAVRLGSARRDDHPGRQPGQRLCPGQGPC